MLSRVLEPEVMDSAAEAGDYDAMDHREVNRQFVNDLLDFGAGVSNVLDLGTGTAQIPIELCRLRLSANIVAVDAAEHMLKLAAVNVRMAGLAERITLQRVDAKRLPFADRVCSTVMSNSIVHHIPEPLAVLREAVRVCAPGGSLFFRDLMRPPDLEMLDRFVAQYSGDANAHQQQMFRESLHAALSLEEIRTLVESLGFSGETVQPTSDRHWTWLARCG
jgi:ubiquinone/menaquinone biosynthesis C-methylase UbiE